MAHRIWTKAGPVAVMLLLLVSPVFGKEDSGFIDREAARKLALEAIKLHNSGVEMADLPDNYAPPFFVFEANAYNLPGSVHVGTYAVNPWTGDVWSTAGYCEFMTNPGLRRMQADIRRKYRRQAGKHWAEWKKLKPWCDAD